MQREPRKHIPNRAAPHLRLVADATSAETTATAPPRTRARDRIVIVPLDPPAPSLADVRAAVRDSQVPPLAPPMPQITERRHEWPGRPGNPDPFARLACPKCSARPRIDHVDLVWSRVHLSCDECCWMWQDRVRSTDRPQLGKLVGPEG